MSSQQATPVFDVEALIKACLPGGYVCDPQQVADAIRAYMLAAAPVEFVPVAAFNRLHALVEDQATRLLAMDDSLVTKMATAHKQLEAEAKLLREVLLEIKSGNCPTPFPMTDAGLLGYHKQLAIKALNRPTKAVVVEGGGVECGAKDGAEGRLAMSADEWMQATARTVQAGVTLAQRQIMRVAYGAGQRSVSRQCVPASVHPDDDAVDRFAARMKRKLERSRAKGRSGWQDPSWTADQISVALREHVEKGDPTDVANYCMFLMARGESIMPAGSDAAVDPWKLEALGKMDKIESMMNDLASKVSQRSDGDSPVAAGALQLNASAAPKGADLVEPKADNPWREAVEDRLLVGWVAACADPREAVTKLVAMECQIALDPAVSRQAEALVQRGRDEVLAASGPVVLAKEVADVVASWRDLVLNAHGVMDGVLDSYQTNQVLGVLDDMSGEVEGVFAAAKSRLAPQADAVDEPASF